MASLDYLNRCESDGFPSGTTGSTLYLAADVRIRLGPWGVGDKILIERLTTRQRWTVNQPTAAVVVAFSGGRDRYQATDFLRQVLGVDTEQLDRQIDALIQRGLLTSTPPADDPVADHWRSHGWADAYDHHLATYNFPLIDYSIHGWATDHNRMALYRQSMPDPGPLHHDNCTTWPPVLELDDALHKELSIPLTKGILGTNELQPLTVDKLAILLAKTFCFTNKNPGQKCRRTSPSGGARHPTEGYVITDGVDGLAGGVYHIDSANSILRQVSGRVSREWARANVEGLFMAPFEPQALIVVTAVFFRSMYRYREPRTFRTVFMDIGHLLGTLEILAKSLGTRSFIHHAINEAEVEKVLKLSPLREGVIAGAALAGAA